MNRFIYTQKHLSFFIIFCIFFAISFFGLNPDFGFHLQTGNYYLAHGIPDTDIFTYTARDFPWVNHAWLSDLIIASLYKLGDYSLVAAFFSLIWTLSLLLASRSQHYLALLLTTVGLSPYIGIRPMAFTVLFVVILLYLLKQKNNQKYFIGISHFAKVEAPPSRRPKRTRGTLREPTEVATKRLAKPTGRNLTNNWLRQDSSEVSAEVILDPELHRVARQKGTEAPFSGQYWDNHETGSYMCAICGAELFSSDTKFDSGTGWPSFTNPVNRKNIIIKEDLSHNLKRQEVTCANCHAHLGHVFDDGPADQGGQRYCINSICLDLKKK
jgi:peptide-methionine (R)-S-oxide reductase